ncbi:MAG: primosomal protein N', partial [Eubacterium sp.]|nr:primosomal protein N' [Eubacterium sp.]
MIYVNVAIDTKSRYMDALYTYSAPDGTAVGDVVMVPFNKNNRERLGYVFETDVTPDCDVSHIKSVIRRIDDYSLNDEMMKTISWMRTRYGIRYMDGIHCFIPPGKPAKPGHEKRPYGDMVPEEQDIDKLTDEQSLAVDEINSAINCQKPQFFLLKGVTSSGKTEVYMRAIEHALSLGRTAVMLVPEIALTKQVIERFAGRFGRDQIAVLHSHLTQRERFDEWMRLRRGDAKIAIGARIGVFAPLDNIGVIILDEEHESTYKSDQTPKYETVDIAVKRLMSTNGVLILGSATPSVVSYERAREGVYKLIELKKRFNETLLPEVRIIDMRDELRKGNRGIFSSELVQEMEETLGKGEQVILFMNRRGYSTYVQCRDCGEPLKCPECGITLVYHKSVNAAGRYASSVKGGTGAAVCHYCGRAYPVPAECPSCGGRELRYLGTGTEKVQELAEQLFPDASVDRLDLDTAKNTREINRIIGDFSKKKTNILVGTQLVAKGLDFDSVGLVGIISA